MFSFLNKSVSDNTRTLFDFKINSIDGKEINLSIYKGKTILVVNVASKCGFTKQYDDLQNLYDLYSEKGLIVLGVPSNQFGGQEPASETEIKNFCKGTRSKSKWLWRTRQMCLKGPQNPRGPF